MAQAILQFIGGHWRAGRGNGVLFTTNPATGSVIGEFPPASIEDLEAAAQSSAKGFARWSHTPAWERSQILMRVGDLLRERKVVIAALITREQGKPTADGLAEVDRAADFFTWAGGEAPRVYGRSVSSRTHSIHQAVERVAVGPVCAFTPWNFPIVLLAKKLSAALAAGCSCIAKPSEETPSAAIELVRACLDAGVEPEAVNLVLGDPATISDYLIAHDAVRKVTFTGSIAVGKALAAKAGSHMKSVTMELGGHAPVLVMDDANIESAASIAASRKFHNAGQTCISPTRFYVHDAVYDDFKSAFVRASGQLKVGPGDRVGIDVGPLANPRRLSAVREAIDDAVQRGAQTLLGSEVQSEGYFHAPTILEMVPSDASLMRMEPFGPVATLTRVKNFDMALIEANRLPYALAAYGFSTSAHTQSRMANEFEAGLVGINTMPGHVPELPVGGWKESGLGSEGGSEALDAYLLTKLVCTQPA